MFGHQKKEPAQTALPGNGNSQRLYRESAQPWASGPHWRHGGGSPRCPLCCPLGRPVQPRWQQCHPASYLVSYHGVSLPLVPVRKVPGLRAIAAPWPAWSVGWKALLNAPPEVPEMGWAGPGPAKSMGWEGERGSDSFPEGKGSCDHETWDGCPRPDQQKRLLSGSRSASGCSCVHAVTDMSTSEKNVRVQVSTASSHTWRLSCWNFICENTKAVLNEGHIIDVAYL